MDFKLLIAELQAAGLTQEQMAEACNCAQSTISDLARGETQTPRFHIGMKLLELHKTLPTAPAPELAEARAA